jgi:hypothetical protein
MAGFEAATRTFKDQAILLQEEIRERSAAILSGNGQGRERVNAPMTTATGAVLLHGNQGGASRDGAQPAAGLPMPQPAAQPAATKGLTARSAVIPPLYFLLAKIKARNESHGDALACLQKMLDEVGGGRRVGEGVVNRQDHMALDANDGNMEEEGRGAGNEGVEVWLYQNGDDVMLSRSDLFTLISPAKQSSSTMGGMFANVQDFKSVELKKADLLDAFPSSVDGRKVLKAAKAMVNAISLGSSIVEGMCTLCRRALDKGKKEGEVEYWTQVAGDVQACATTIVNALRSA